MTIFDLHRRQRFAVAAPSGAPQALPSTAVLLDAIVIVGAGTIAAVGHERLTFLHQSGSPLSDLRLAGPMMIVAWLAAICVAGGYSRGICGAGTEELKRVANAGLVTAGAVGVGCYLVGFPLSKDFFLLSFALGIPALALGRIALRGAPDGVRHRDDPLAQEERVQADGRTRRPHAPSGVGHPGAWEPTSEQRVRHDLRQSLGLLMALAAGVKQNLGQVSEVLRYLEQMRRETERMTELVSAQVAAGEPQRVDVGQVVADRWRSAVAAAPCDMQLVCDSSTLAVLDPVALARSVQNLLDNAVRAAGGNGAVVVRVRNQGDTVSVSVSDTGPGFGNVPTQQGLGLVTVRRFAAECGGTLEVGGSRRRGAELVLRMPSATPVGEELTCAS